MITRISQEESVMVAVLYDELQRKSWARRAGKGGTTLNLLVEVKAKSLSQVELAKSKVKLVTRAAGLESDRDDGQQGAPASVACAESSINKQMAHATSVTKKVEEALRKLNNQQGPQQFFGGSPQRNNNKRKHGGGQYNNAGRGNFDNKRRKGGGKGKWK